MAHTPLNCAPPELISSDSGEDSRTDTDSPSDIVSSGDCLRSPSKLGQLSPRVSLPSDPRSSRSPSPTEEVASDLRVKLRALEGEAEDIPPTAAVRRKTLPRRRNSDKNSFSPLLIQATRSASFTQPRHEGRRVLSPVLLARVLGVDRQSSICAASEQADLPDLSKQNDVLSSVMSLCADRSPSLMKRQAHLSPLVTDSAFNIDKLHFGLHNVNQVPTITTDPLPKLSPPRGGVSRLFSSRAFMKSLKDSS